MDLSDYRQEYLKDALTRSSVEPCPFQQFTKWFQQAVDADYPEPNAMSIATASSAAAPSLRTVLLKYFDTQGFVFFTNYQSRKAKEIAENPQVSLLFPWINLERQVVVLGRIEKISKEESLKYFQSRPHDSQLGAWVSYQSSVIPDREWLATKLDELNKQYAPGEVPLPEFWGGYRVIPHHIEFWQGGPARLHDRILYSKSDDASEWSLDRLSP
ncbi:pyridoxamine 5'-phosphate oxidase [Rubritalea tangerina]|uniref:Pyridoxamine 5'-phosphate oxidase n=1 Tax=Rubritalea tangerina TaxID=430798 RepID=A0ABW4ZD40_9BACT